MRIGVQTYTIRNLVKEDLKKTLLQLKNLGVEMIEVSRIPYTDVNAKIIKESTFKVVSLQITLKELIKNKNEVISFCKITNCRIVVVSVLSIEAIIGGLRSLKKFCNLLNSTAEMYLKENIQLAFHHHDFEFKKLKGISKLDWIINYTSDYVKIVTDTYWTKKSGFEPHLLIEKLQNRLIGVHLRDLANNLKTDCEVGYGVIDFDKVLAYVNKIDYLVIEQNTPTPIESLKKSIDYLKNI